MKDPIKVKELILSRLNLADIMLAYGVEFIYNPKLAEQVQFRCPFHGRDNKPSARLYNDTQTCYCWFCKKKWDVVSFIMQAENLSFRAALQYLTNRYRIDVSTIPDEPEIKKEKVTVSYDNVNMMCLRNNIVELRQKISLEKYARLCFVFLNVSYDFSRGLNVSESIRKIEDKVRTLKE